MNRGNRHPAKQLPPCPKCGLDSGKRVVTTGAIELYAVKCESCGYTTRLYQAQAVATRMWGKEAAKCRKS